MNMDCKAQTSIETLLLIGGAILVATVVGVYLKGMLPGIGNRITIQANALNNS